jgi:hypothetical protein
MENQTIWIVFTTRYNYAGALHVLTSTSTLELATEICEHHIQILTEQYAADLEYEARTGHHSRFIDRERALHHPIEVWRLHHPKPNFEKGFLIQESKFEVPSQYVLK